MRVKMKNDLITIIVPIYNTEKYLERCLDSVVKQTRNIEIIAVNDGSYDNSLKILEKYANKYSNIKIINQQLIQAVIEMNQVNKKTQITKYHQMKKKNKKQRHLLIF